MDRIINKQIKPKTVVEKIRRFRNDFYNAYMKRHKKFEMHRFVAEFLKKPVSKTA